VSCSTDTASAAMTVASPLARHTISSARSLPFAVCAVHHYSHAFMVF